MSPARVLVLLAWLNVVFHAAGLIVAAVGLRPGTALAPLSERMAYLAGRPPLWQVGWGVWMICAMLLVAYLVAAERLLEERSRLARLATTFAAAGLGVDLLCEVINLAVLPAAAATGPSEVFLAIEGLTFTGGATVANGLYTTAVLFLTRVTLLARTPRARASGYGAVSAGYLMAVAGLIPSPTLLQYAVGPTIILYCLWVVVAARDLQDSGGRRP